MATSRGGASPGRAVSDAANRTELVAAETRSTIARVGLVGKAMLYGIFALIAVNLATNSGSTTTDGAIENLASGSFGRVLLIVLTVGLVTLVAWKALQALAGDPVEGSEASDRAKFALKGLSYFGVAAASVAVLVANWGGGSNSSGGGGGKQEATATVLGWPGGQFLVVLAGLGIIAFGLYELYKHALNAGFLERLDLASLDASAEEGIELAGRVGYAAHGTITAIAGVFLLVAGVQHDPDETKGLSGVLQELADATWGTILLWVIAVGLILFALFTLAEAKLRRAT